MVPEQLFRIWMHVYEEAERKRMRGETVNAKTRPCRCGQHGRVSLACDEVLRDGEPQQQLVFGERPNDAIAHEPAAELKRDDRAPR